MPMLHYVWHFSVHCWATNQAKTKLAINCFAKRKNTWLLPLVYRTVLSTNCHLQLTYHWHIFCLKRNVSELTLLNLNLLSKREEKSTRNSWPNYKAYMPHSVIWFSSFDSSRAIASFHWICIAVQYKLVCW